MSTTTEVKFSEQNLVQRIRGMGALRNMLQLTALIFAAMMPVSGMPAYSDTWDLFFGGVVPAMGPIIVIVLGLDVLMAQVWKDQETPERIAALSFVVKANVVCGGILLIAFLAVFLPVLTP